MEFGRLLQDLQRRFRSRRMAVFIRRFCVETDTRILDIGGTAYNWGLTAVRPRVLLANVTFEPEAWSGEYTQVVCDGRALPFPDAAFDIAYSNSVIEHVGDLADIQQFARELSRVAPRYYVQTPYRWFPIEPHILGLMIHWFPVRVARRLVPILSIWGLRDRPTPADVDRQLSTTRLLTVKELRGLFPDGIIIRERLLGLTKSIVVAKL